MKDFDTELREILKTPIEKRADNFPTELTETALEEAWEKEKENIYQEIIDDIKQAISERLPEKKDLSKHGSAIKNEGDKIIATMGYPIELFRGEGHNKMLKQTRERLGLDE